MDPLVAELKAQTLALGFTKVGIARAQALQEEGEKLRAWLARGYEGTMAWMERSLEKRIDPRRVLHDAQSVIVVAMNYFSGESHSSDAHTGKISRYAWGDDYHELLASRLEELKGWLDSRCPGSRSLVYVDTGPMMDKAWAVRSGIGWEGKHTNVITREVGSWVFLGELLTTVELPAEEPAVDHCGTCTRCIEACPTGAIVEPYVVDSNLCLSYLTIEHRGAISPEIAGHFDGWIYGCDVCQDVCPWNRKFATQTREAGFTPREGNVSPSLLQWQDMSQEEFSSRFRGSPIKRAKREGLLRNIAVVRQNADPKSPPDASDRTVSR